MQTFSPKHKTHPFKSIFTPCPQAAPLSSVDSYGAPAAGVINPRTPAQTNRRVSVVRPQTPPVHSQPIPLNPGYKVGRGFTCP